MNTITLTQDTLAQIIADAVAQAVAAQVVPSEPASQAPVEENTFVTWLHETAEARHARKTSNREMAAWLRSKDLPTNGPVWEAAKKGERSVRALRKLA